MKKLLVLGDTHGHKSNIAAALSRFAGVDMIVHLGDYCRDARLIRSLTKVPVYSVKGNCDIGSDEEGELMLSVSGVRILALHGHKQAVKSSLLRLGLYAQEKQADIALFGHTHVPCERRFHTVRLYNPGSLGEPRGMRPSVGIITIEDGKVRIKTTRL